MIRGINIYKFYFKNFWLKSIILFILLIIQSIILISSVFILVPLIEFFIDNDLSNPTLITKIFISLLSILNINVSLGIIILFFIIINFFKSFIFTAVSFFIISIKYSIYKSILENLLNSILYVRWTFFYKTDHSKLLNTINNEAKTAASTLSDIITQVALLFRIIAYLVTPLYLDFKLTVSTILISLIFAVPIYFSNKISFRLGKITLNSANEKIGFLNQTLQSAKLILGFGIQKSIIEKNLNILKTHINAALKSVTLQIFVENIYQPLAITALAISIFYFNTNNNIINLPAILWSLIAAVPLISGFLRGNNVINSLLPSFEQISEIEEISKKYSQEIHNKIKIDSFNNTICFNNVAYSYDNKKTIYNNVDIKFQKGKTILIKGESGTGKSTLIDMIMGLIKPDSGYITIDGINYNEINFNSLRKIIGYVPQDPFLFDMSIKSNFQIFKKDISENEIWNLLKIANIDDHVRSLPNRLDELVGSRGLKLSGGQRQRICFARSLVNNPKILILDEATNSLDEESEKIIFKSLFKLKNSMTIFVISHKKDTIMKYDDTYLIHDTKIEKIN